VNAAAAIGIDLKAVKTPRTILCLKEFHGALIHHTAAELPSAKAGVQPIVHAVIERILIGTWHTMRFLP
jgi:hypothetical protein